MRMKQIINHFSITGPVITFLPFIILWLYCFNGQAKNPEAEISYKNFVIKYQPDDENFAHMVQRVLEPAIPEYENFYGVKLQSHITVSLPSSLLDIDQSILHDLPEWSNAVFLPELQKIILKKPQWYSNDQQLSQVFRHELSHAYFHQRFGSRQIPLWFNEGLAEFLGGTHMDISNGVVISNALFTGNLIPLQDMDSLLTYSWSRARLAYLQSFTAIRFLEKQLQQHGNHWLNFFNAIDNYGFEPALKMSTGMDRIDFEIKWYHWVDDQYKWFVIFNWENLIWVFMVLVMAGALYAIRYRNRKILRQWESEEKINNQDQMTSMLES